MTRRSRSTHPPMRPTPPSLFCSPLLANAPHLPFHPIPCHPMPSNPRLLPVPHLAAPHLATQLPTFLPRTTLLPPPPPPSSLLHLVLLSRSLPESPPPLTPFLSCSPSRAPLIIVPPSTTTILPHPFTALRSPLQPASYPTSTPSCTPPPSTRSTALPQPRENPGKSSSVHLTSPCIYHLCVVEERECASAHLYVHSYMHVCTLYFYPMYGATTSTAYTRP